MSVTVPGKHTTVWLLLICSVFMLMAGGCGGGRDGEDDGLRVTGTVTRRPAVLVGERPEINFLPAFENRLVNKIGNDITDEAEVIVLHNSHVELLPDGQKTALKKAYERGAVIVLVEPTYDELVDLSVIVGHDLTAARDADARHFCDMYAFNGEGHTYVLGDIHPDPAPSESPANLSDGEYGAIMDPFVGWIDNNGPENFSSGGPGDGQNDAALEKLVKAQSVTFNNKVSVGSIVSAGSTGKGYAPYWYSVPAPYTTRYTNTYWITAVHDSTAGIDADYYIIDQSVTLVNGNMYRDPWVGDLAASYKAQIHFYGGWLAYYSTDHFLEDSDGRRLSYNDLDLYSPQPTTVSRATTYTTTQSYTISGQLGFNSSGGTGSLTGSATYSSARAMTVSDVEVKYQSGQTDRPVSGGIKDYRDHALVDSGTKNARWEYVMQNRPIFTKRPSTFYPHTWRHSDPTFISVNTAVFYNSWIWKISNVVETGDRKPSFNLRTRNAPWYAFMWGIDLGGSDSIDSTYAYVIPYNKNTEYQDVPITTFPITEQVINLTPPPRTRPQ